MKEGTDFKVLKKFSEILQNQMRIVNLILILNYKLMNSDKFLKSPKKIVGERIEIHAGVKKPNEIERDL